MHAAFGTARCCTVPTLHNSRGYERSRTAYTIFRTVSFIHNHCLVTSSRTPLNSGTMQAVNLTRSLGAPRMAVVGRAPRRTLVVTAGTISSNDFKPGVNIEVDQQPYKVIEFLHVKPGKGAAFVRTKLKNYLTGNSVEKTFRGGEILSTADVQKKDGQFTYMDADEYVFMDTESYEETRLKRDDWANFLKEGSTCQLLFYNGKVISVDPPQFVDLKVAETGPNVKGNTAAGGSKPATLETGAVISVPLFIEIGESIKVDTTKGIYLSRSSSNS